jgi:hypothetical protein
MQDLDIPPQVEGDTNGAVGVVRLNVAQAELWDATARSIKEFSLLPWTTIIAPI